MFLGNLMLQTRCLAWYTLRKHGRCGSDESGSRKCDDCCLHLSVLPHWNKKPEQRLKLNPLGEQAASRYGEGAVFILSWRSLVGVKSPGDFRLSDELVVLSQKVARFDFENQLFEEIQDWRARC
jgi:hypothetical protein